MKSIAMLVDVYFQCATSKFESFYVSELLLVSYLSISSFISTNDISKLEHIEP